MSNETPIGQSAVSAGQVRPQPSMDQAASPAPAAVPVEGPTPDGETAQTAPPVTQTAEQIETSRSQNVGNLALLARQAIGMGFETMSVDPKIIADFCSAYAQADQAENVQTPDVIPEGALEHAREEGRREAVASFAQERAELHQSISSLEAKLGLDVQTQLAEGQKPADESAAQEGDEGFKGPGQS